VNSNLRKEENWKTTLVKKNLKMDFYALIADTNNAVTRKTRV
jgi:hypothetical protein